MTDNQFVVIIITVVVLAVAAAILLHRQSLRHRFADEYDRLVTEQHGHLAAYRELRRRERRLARLDIRPLSDEAGIKYAEQWRDVQARFIDDPRDAVSDADALLTRVIADRGYPTADAEEMLANLSVKHARSLSGLREARAISVRDASTEQLRQVMVSYRTVFVELLGSRLRLDNSPATLVGCPPGETDPPDA